MSEPQQDRRAYKRIRARFDVIYSDGTQTAQGTAIDIGQGGLALIAEHRFPEGTEIEIRLRQPGASEDLLRTKAIVRYSEQNSLRVQFVDLQSPEEIEALIRKSTL